MGEKDIFPGGRTSIMGDPGLIPGGYGHPCLWCGEPSPRESFCSDSCQDRFMSWLQTEPASLRGVLPPFWNIIRRSALQRDGYRCQVCGGGVLTSRFIMSSRSRPGETPPRGTSGFSAVHAIRESMAARQNPGRDGSGYGSGTSRCMSRHRGSVTRSDRPVLTGSHRSPRSLSSTPVLPRTGYHSAG